MKKILEKLSLGKIAWGIIFGVIILSVASWASVCITYGLVCLLFSWDFSWAVATGIWLVLVVLKRIFRKVG